MDAREKALYTLVKLRALADHPNTPKTEADAARAKIKTLEHKHKISATEQVKQSAPPPFRPPSDWLADLARQQAAAREAMRRRMADRAKAQRDYEQSMADKDANGQPRDPFHDPRTHAQRQADLNNSFGKNDAWYNRTFNDPPWPGAKQTYSPPPKPRCSPALPYFNIGGEPYERNKTDTTCVKCGNKLFAGMGAHHGNVGDGVVCCDMVPGPRQKKSGTI